MDATSELSRSTPSPSAVDAGECLVGQRLAGGRRVACDLLRAGACGDRRGDVAVLQDLSLKMGGGIGELKLEPPLRGAVRRRSREVSSQQKAV
jgi:hypothetical protein